MGEGLMDIEGIDQGMIVHLIKSAESKEQAERLFETALAVAYSAGVIKGGTDAFARADAILASFMVPKGTD